MNNNNGIVNYDNFYNNEKENKNNLKMIKIGKGQKFRLNYRNLAILIHENYV